MSGLDREVNLLIELFRVYDLKKKRWLTKNVFVSQYGDLYIMKEGLFKNKMELASASRYVAHHSTGFTDKNSVTIFEGDICRVDDDSIDIDINKDWLVIYREDMHCFIALNQDGKTFTVLTPEVVQYLTVVGDVFTDPYEIVTDPEPDKEVSEDA